mmetsp:Transcript_82664/g.267609  ORF Transcript_82664/g.267609 Transcript_82664/m.267609 type:complete len:285 (-) Transcript_82664:1384-2238(-)
MAATSKRACTRRWPAASTALSAARATGGPGAESMISTRAAQICEPASQVPPSSSSHCCHRSKGFLNSLSPCLAFCMRTALSSRASEASSSYQYSRLTVSSPTARSSQRARRCSRSCAKRLDKPSSVRGNLAPSGSVSPPARARNLRQLFLLSASATLPQVVCCKESQAVAMLTSLPLFIETTRCRRNARKAVQLSGWLPTNFGLAWHVLRSEVWKASRPFLKSSGNPPKGKLSKAWGSAGLGSAWQLRRLHNFSKLCRKSEAPLLRSVLSPCVRTVPQPRFCSR